MPKETIWKPHLGNLAPIKEFPRGRRPTVRDMVMVFRHYHVKEDMNKRDAAQIVLKKLKDADVDAVDASIAPNTAISYVVKFWERTL